MQLTEGGFLRNSLWLYFESSFLVVSQALFPPVIFSFQALLKITVSEAGSLTSHSPNFENGLSFSAIILPFSPFPYFYTLLMIPFPFVSFSIVATERKWRAGWGSMNWTQYFDEIILWFTNVYKLLGFYNKQRN